MSSLGHPGTQHRFGKSCEGSESTRQQQQLHHPGVCSLPRGGEGRLSAAVGSGTSQRPRAVLGTTAWERWQQLSPCRAPAQGRAGMLQPGAAAGTALAGTEEPCGDCRHNVLRNSDQRHPGVNWAPLGSGTAGLPCACCAHHGSDQGWRLPGTNAPTKGSVWELKALWGPHRADLGLDPE